jgi:hypothetical protein
MVQPQQTDSADRLSVLPQPRIILPGTTMFEVAFHMPTTCQLQSQPSQEWLAAYDNGSLDGSVSTPICSNCTLRVDGVALGYWTGGDLPFMYEER